MNQTLEQSPHETRAHAARRTRRSAVGWALLLVLPLFFLVLPSIVRLVRFAQGAVPADATDVAFAAHSYLGLTHVVAGLVLAAIVPMQLSARVRRRWPALHRAAGWVFALMSVGVLGSGAWMNLVFPRLGGLWKVAAIDTMIVGFAVTLGVALVAIKRGDVAAHRRWMFRMLAFALAGGTASVVLFPYFLTFGLPSDTVVALGRWLSVTFNVGLVEFFLRSRKPGVA